MTRTNHIRQPYILPKRTVLLAILPLPPTTALVLMAATAAISATMLTDPNRNLHLYGLKNRDRASVYCCVGSSGKRKLPVLLFDVMDTIVRDPFYEDVPAFFRMPMKELLERKHPTAWFEFEEGLIDEDELIGKFFKDGRDFDLEGLKECMRSGYSYLDGMQQLLHALRDDDYEIHAFTNYPVWYEMIEEKLKLSAYLSWTFCSCTIGKRKPDPDFYLKVVKHLGVEPCDCIFIDDRLKNVDSARQIGMVGIRFENAETLKEDLARHGVEISLRKNDECNR
ncbi:PREDICTED: uncharacterized protein LOC104813550 [Tarenaya hassleriana]|uniref:uncharacterized protein LOC104813550 n=1 Tax=Tarenaya hassleriana TaxID=28532 RepID=UPI00053C9D44|nr:PREDICTED: uncharacterized protein LOC104813550 [Tarenaya hassleriana]